MTRSGAWARVIGVDGILRERRRGPRIDDTDLACTTGSSSPTARPIESETDNAHPDPKPRP